MRVPVFEHEKMLPTTDFIFSYLRLQAKREYSILLEGQIFERMTQDGHERGSPPRMKTPFRRVASTGFFFHTEISRSGCSCAEEPGNMVSSLSEKSDAVERETEMLDLYHRLCIPYVRLNLHLPGAISRVSRSGARPSHAQESRVVRVGTLLKSPTTDDLRTGAGSTRCT